MAKVLGVGGIFFKSKDPKALMRWYQEHLGIPGDAGYAVFKTDTVPPGGATVFSAFKADTTYFAPSEQSFMLNLMVDDLEAALKQVASGGGTLVGEPESHPNGSFGWFLDPDGNKIELWQPKPMD